MAVLLSAASVDSVAGPEPAALLAYLCGAGDGEIALLHSAAGQSQSVLAFDPLITLEVDAGGKPHLSGRVDVGDMEDVHPLGILERIIDGVSFDAPHPLIGWLGFISYDIGRTVESIAATASDELHWPLLHWTLFRHYLLHDPASRRWTPISLDGDPAGSHELVRRAAAAPCAELPAAGPAVMRRFISAADFKSRVQRARDYIAAGDIYQANIAQRWQIATADAPQDIYRRLCACSPAPYGAFMRFASADGLPRHVLSASPELFLSVDSRRTITRPIKGTRRRNLADPSHDARLRDELLASEKDRAELAMIVDLMRNDLGRVSEFGSVSVDAPRDIEQHPTVWHTVATISALLRRNAGLAELLAAVCPGGSITGAPKIRAMQIIEELESIRRGLYCGNIGVIGPQARTINLNVAIRTLLMQASCAYVHAGGGIVADSDPHLEYDETLAKAAAMLRALGAQSLAP